MERRSDLLSVSAAHPPALNKCRSGGGYIIVGHVFLQLPVSVSSGNKQGYAWLALHEAAAKRGPRRGILQLTHSYRWGSENCNLHFLPPPPKHGGLLPQLKCQLLAADPANSVAGLARLGIVSEILAPAPHAGSLWQHRKLHKHRCWAAGAGLSSRRFDACRMHNDECT